MPKTKQFDEIEVLLKAREVFNEKGFTATSMDDLVKATGLSRSSIYDTFGDKHGLFMKALEDYKLDQQNAITETLAKIDSPKKRISTLFHNVIQEIVSDKKKKGCLLLNAGMELTSVDEKVAALASLGMVEMEEIFYGWIKEGQTSGEITKRFTAKALAKHLYNSFAGLRLTGKCRPDATALKETVKIALAALDD